VRDIFRVDDVAKAIEKAWWGGFARGVLAGLLIALLTVLLLGV